ncbi:hypothetical protein JI664_22270 [Rhodobacter sp. NTK016B]|uniref:hypothetical protein n=1 Tax=Rhodobacter sp. NTK016B TaxID=2759676 RepID=UPI001A8F9531|nr:hypothetical protein [Rhodobacter sp. NTK016B]MBN8294713.1 hypothetical protein [Rhodobacter sp. NTK016B]
MSRPIAMLEAPLVEMTGKPGPRILHDFTQFQIIGRPCRVRTSAGGEAMVLSVDGRDFMLSIVELAAHAAVAIEGKLKSEMRSRILADHGAPPITPLTEVPVAGAVEADGFVTMFASSGRGCVQRTTELRPLTQKPKPKG